MERRKRICRLIVAILILAGVFAGAKKAYGASVMTTSRSGWEKTRAHWQYRDIRGKKVSGWKKISGKWYYFDSNGRMYANRWRKWNGSWYYIGSNGSMKTGWLHWKNNWYYLRSNGSMKTGWLKSNGKWYYFSSRQAGAMLKERLMISEGNRYYSFARDGAMTENRVSIVKRQGRTEMVRGLCSRNQEIQMFNAVNRYRALNGRRKLAFDRELQQAARYRAAEISLNYPNYFSHVRPDGSHCWSISNQAEAENIVMNSWKNCSYSMQLLKDSPEHNETMLNSGFKTLGIGVFVTDNAAYYTQIFGY